MFSCNIAKIPHLFYIIYWITHFLKVYPFHCQALWVTTLNLKTTVNIIIKNNWNSHDYILSRITDSTKNNSRFNPRNNTFYDEILSLKTRQEIHLISLWQTKWHGQMFRKIMKGQVAWQNEKVGCCKFQLLLARQIFQFYILPI